MENTVKNIPPTKRLAAAVPLALEWLLLSVRPLMALDVLDSSRRKGVFRVSRAAAS